MTIYGDANTADRALDAIGTGKVLFTIALSYTYTSEIAGITIAGASRDTLRYTPPADAEYIVQGHCDSIRGVPVTPDGKPTPAIMTRVALQVAGIPVMPINAGGLVPPAVPHIETHLMPGNDISRGRAMSVRQADVAITTGKRLGRTLSNICDCLIIGESIPGGTTTALATMKGLGYDCMVSSSMPENPIKLKKQVADAAVSRVDMYDPVGIISQVSDPMLPFVAGMVDGASPNSKVILAGGTQMMAVLAICSRCNHHTDDTVIATTSYVAEDPSVRFANQVRSILDVPIISTDPGFDRSTHPGLRSYTAGFAKEGAGAGGSLAAASARIAEPLLEHIDIEYSRLVSP